MQTKITDMWGVDRDLVYGRDDLASYLQYPDSEPQHSAMLAGEYQRMGFPLAFGTDIIYLSKPDDAIDIELGMLNTAGLTPAEILRTMTVNAAKHAERPDLDTISEGATADLIITGTDPLSTTDFTKDIDVVVKDGSVVYQASDKAI